MPKVVRRGSWRYLLLSLLLLLLILCIYYMNYGANITSTLNEEKVLTHKLAKQGQHPPDLLVQEAEDGAGVAVADPAIKQTDVAENTWFEPDITVTRDTCPIIKPAKTDVDTVVQFQKFEFQPSWMRSKEYWDSNFEQRYNQRKAKWSQLPLKVIVVPHSHNDPGWLKTYDGYFHYQTRNILNGMVDKLQIHKNMTFIWTEISFFSKWWESVHPTKRRIVNSLLKEGRLEITTGGWIMTDEANVHLYSMVDQLIEGHQWCKHNLGITPKSSWSIDPFGHGATMPYLLKSSGLENMVIQRIHYAWKQWLAEQQMGDFMWRQNWDKDGKTDILCHNFPYDIYSIKHSCGPHPQVCLSFDFRKIPGEYTEYSVKAVPIDARNVREKAELLLEQYGRTGSLFPHNVVLVPVGDDFRYDHEIEWDQQYKNYKTLMDFINSNKEYNAEINFGTLSDYFTAVRERMRGFQSLKGDFFVYSDIFSEGRPAYWSGYFTTRPYWKLLSRELEASLRSAEILYTIALNTLRQHGFNKAVQIFEREYEKLVKARWSLGLFQHHDAITGTSKSFVMHDYALKLFEGIQNTVTIQSRSAQVLLAKDTENSLLNQSKLKQQMLTFLLPDFDRESYDKLPRKLPVFIGRNEPRRLALFNSLAQHRQEVVCIKVHVANIRVTDSEGMSIPFQISPVFNVTDNGLYILRNEFELTFVAELPPLSINVFTIDRIMEKSVDERAIVYCKECEKTNNPSLVSPFEIKHMQAGDIQLENHKLKLLFDGHTAFMKAVTKKSTGRTTQCGIQFSAYPSAQFHSGAYLFMPDPNSRDPEKEVLTDGTQQIFIVSGPISSEITVLYEKFLIHSIRVYHVEGALSEGVYVENILDFGPAPKYRETELFMRLVTDISNGEVPEFYGDLNGFQMQKRVKVERIGIEGNYYPITSMAYIQDTKQRLTLLVNHAHGAASWQPGWLEVMLDRRTLYDDSRGMGEGVVDNKKTKFQFWLLLEEHESPSDAYSSPSLYANHMSNNLNYPANLFIVDGIDGQSLHKKVELITKPFPCDVHLLNLRTTSDQLYDQFPSSSALLVIHKQGYSCDVAAQLQQCSVDSHALHKSTAFSNLQIKAIEKTTLTGLHSLEVINSLDDIHIEAMEIHSYNVTFTL